MVYTVIFGDAIMLGKVFLLFGILALSDACSSLGSHGGCGGGCRKKAMAAGRLDIDGNLPPNYVYGLGLWTDKQPMKNASMEQLTNPNHLFAACCEERGLPFACARHCHFSLFSEEFITEVTTGIDKCPLTALPEIHFCAAQGRDHRKCCDAKGVGTTLAGDRCLVFCNQTPNTTVNIDYTYLPCFERFGTMKQCFFNGVLSEARDHFGQETRLL